MNCWIEKTRSLVIQRAESGWVISRYMHEGSFGGGDLVAGIADDEGLLEFFAEQLSLPAPLKPSKPDDVSLQAVRTEITRHAGVIATYDLRGHTPQPLVTEAPAAAIVPPPVSADLVSHMVNRFLRWRLPENFAPDGGITFTRVMNEGTQYEHTAEPSGTNLFDYTQATAMVRHMLEGLP